MIELPEAVVIAQQISSTLTGKRIARAVRGNTPHKFAFYSGEPTHYATSLKGKVIGQAYPHGAQIMVRADPGWLVVLGGGGERILYHRSPESLPPKHHLLLEFEDATALSVTVQGWGACLLFKADDPAATRWCGAERGRSPVDDAFTPDYFESLFRQLEPDDPRSVKYFIISKPGLLGVGNGYLQDILFRARLHPRTRAIDLSAARRKSLFKAVKQTITAAIQHCGRDDEHDLFDHTGRYHRILSAQSANTPCQECGTDIVKDNFLGGAVYFCPKCQPAPEPRPRSKRPSAKHR